MTTKQQSSYYQQIVAFPAPNSKLFLEGLVEHMPCFLFKQLKHIPTADSLHYKKVN